MSEIRRPTASVLNDKRRTSLLAFDNVENAKLALDGEWVMRCGICWPVHTSVMGARFEGFAVVVGQKVVEDEPGMKVLFEEFEFYTVEPRIAGGELNHQGLAMWLGNIWAWYKCDFLFHSQDEYTHRTRLRELRESHNVQRKPRFKHVQLDDEKICRNVIAEHIQRGDLKWRKGDKVDERYDKFLAQPWGSMEVPAIHAMTCVLVGMQRYRWRAPQVEEETMIMNPGWQYGRIM